MRRLTIIFMLCLILAACTPAPAPVGMMTGSPLPPATKTSTLVPTKTPRTVNALIKEPTEPIKPTQTRINTRGPIPTQALINTFLNGSTEVGTIRQPVVLDHGKGVWSPTANEMVLYNSYTSPGLVRVTAPDFTPVIISPSLLFENYKQPAIWSTDGQKIYFAGPLPKGHNYDPPFDTEYSDLWMVNRDGSNLHWITYGCDSRWLSFYGWMDDHSLVTWDYGGGGHQIVSILDTRTNKWLATTFFGGETYSPTNKYIAGLASEVPWQNIAFVISKKKQANGFGYVYGGYAKAIPAYYAENENYTQTKFVGWQPGTNKMLVQWINKDDGIRQNEIKLLLWDVDTDHITILAPDGISGLFSPGGKYLAYETIKPGKLKDGKPVQSINPSDPKKDPPYIQLLDMATGLVSLSLPIVPVGFEESIWDEIPEPPNANFSPDGRYFSFLTTGDIQIDQNGWSISPKRLDNTRITLGIVDLETKQLVFSKESEYLPNWSPAANKFIYSLNHKLILLDLVSGNETLITKKLGTSISSILWSFDGSYFSGILPTNQIAIFQTP